MFSLHISKKIAILYFISVQIKGENVKKIIHKIKSKLGKDAPTVAVLSLKGVIADNGRSLNLSSIMAMCDKIDDMGKKLDAIALIINSPGGSPVQSALIGSHIRYLAGKHKLPVYAFVEDVAASGGYWIACAADEIYADQNSILGSIGVISGGFGFVEAIEKLGIERRVYTAGKNKSQLDPFQPENNEDIERLKSLQLEIHQSFIDWVKERRGGRLAEHDDLFTGLFWTAKPAMELGLCDGLAHAHIWLKERYGDKVKLKKLAEPKPIWKKFMGKGTFIEDNISSLKTQALWERFGL